MKTSPMVQTLENLMPKGSHSKGLVGILNGAVEGVFERDLSIDLSTRRHTWDFSENNGKHS